MTDRTKGSQGKKTGQQGREAISSLSAAELSAKASELGVSTTNDDGTARSRDEIVNEVANKTRQADRGTGQDRASQAKTQGKGKNKA